MTMIETIPACTEYAYFQGFAQYRQLHGSGINAEALGYGGGAQMSPYGREAVYRTGRRQLSEKTQSMHTQKSAVNPTENSAVHGQGARPMMRLGGQRLTAGGGIARRI